MRLASMMDWQLTITIRPLRLLARFGLLSLMLLVAAVPANRNGDATAAEPSSAATKNAVAVVESILTADASSIAPDRRNLLARVIVGEALACGLDPLFALAVGAVESSFDHEAVSKTGARGLYQVVTSTWNREIKRRGLGRMEKFDPVANAKIGVGYLCFLHKTFKRPDNLLLAYNQGPGTASDIISGRELPSDEASVYGPHVWRAYKALLIRANAAGRTVKLAELRALCRSPERTVYRSAVEANSKAGGKVMTKPKPTLGEKFATNLLKLRKERKLTQGQLAEKSGLSVSYISMLERNERTPPLDTLEAVAKALRIEPTAMLV